MLSRLGRGFVTPAEGVLVHQRKLLEWLRLADAVPEDGTLPAPIAKDPDRLANATHADRHVYLRRTPWARMCVPQQDHVCALLRQGEIGFPGGARAARLSAEHVGLLYGQLFLGNGGLAGPIELEGDLANQQGDLAPTLGRPGKPGR